MTTNESRSCALEACGCVPEGDAAHCGVYCANAVNEDDDESACACGHDACEASQRVPRDPERVSTAIGHGRSPGSDR